MSTLLTPGSFNARTFGSVQHAPAGRPRTSDGKQRVTVSLQADIVRQYDEEAARRWPGSERRRGELMEEALVSWMLALSLKRDRTEFFESAETAGVEDVWGLAVRRELIKRGEQESKVHIPEVVHEVPWSVLPAYIRPTDYDDETDLKQRALARSTRSAPPSAASKQAESE